MISVNRPCLGKRLNDDDYERINNMPLRVAEWEITKCSIKGILVGQQHLTGMF